MRRLTTAVVMALTVSGVLAGGGAATVPADLGAMSRFGAKPLPVDADGIPLAAETAIETIGENESILVAVKPAGSPHWYAPGDVGASVVEGQVASVPSTDIAALDVPTQVGLDSTETSDQQIQFGCNGVNRFPPSYVYPGVIQGGEDFVGCFNLSHRTASVRLKESSTYGTHAARISGKSGNSDWTAWSEPFNCEPISRSWQTVATNIYTATNGASVTYVGSSAWASGFYC